MLYRITIISFAVFLFSIQDISYAQLFNYRAGKMIVNVIHNQKLTVTTNNKGIPVLGITQLDSLNDFYKCISIDRVYYGSHPDTKNLFLFSFKADSDILELSGKYSINSLSYAEPHILL